jgi:acyl-CoA synthetase (AMP-forming)/AMP-acid ligase II/acyl carrier protein
MTRVVGELLARSARLVPDRAAVIVDGQTTLTFAEIDARANAFAHGLRARGVEPGHRVALDLGAADWAYYVVAYVGVLRLGAVALLTATRFPDAELDRIVTGYNVAAVIRGPEHAAASAPGPVLDVTTVECGQPTTPVPVTVRPEDPAEVIFTSGTTARPRGVVATHANLTGAQTTWPTAVRANQPVAHALPLGSVAAQAVLLSCLGGQHTMVVASRFTVADFTALAHRHAVTTVCLVPAMGHWLAQAPAEEVTVVPSVKGVSFSGAALPVAALPDLPRVFPNATFFNFYTSTETYPARVATRVDPARPESVGRPVGASAVQVRGPDGAEVPPGTVGEVWLRAGNAPPRQLLDDDGTGSPVRDGWTRTGDLGYLDDEGYLYLTGRVADIVIVGGVNVSTGRVEQVLARHPAVAEAAVCGVDHPVLGQILAAFVVPRADTTARDLREHARQHLARAEVPAIIRIVADLPRNAAGKVVKRDLPALLDTPGEAEFVAPRTDLERRIADVWARVLQLGAVGVTDNFFEIGGDSLAATRIAGLLREELGLDVDAVAILEAPSVAELAATVVPDRKPEASWKG